MLRDSEECILSRVEIPRLGLTFVPQGPILLGMESGESRIMAWRLETALLSWRPPSFICLRVVIPLETLHMLPTALINNMRTLMDVECIVEVILIALSLSSYLTW